MRKRAACPARRGARRTHASCQGVPTEPGTGTDVGPVQPLRTQMKELRKPQRRAPSAALALCRTGRGDLNITAPREKRQTVKSTAQCHRRGKPHHTKHLPGTSAHKTRQWIDWLPEVCEEGGGEKGPRTMGANEGGECPMEGACRRHDSPASGVPQAPAPQTQQRNTTRGRRVRGGHREAQHFSPWYQGLDPAVLTTESHPSPLLFFI